MEWISWLQFPVKSLAGLGWATGWGLMGAGHPLEWRSTRKKVGESESWNIIFFIFKNLYVDLLWFVWR